MVTKSGISYITCDRPGTRTESELAELARAVMIGIINECDESIIIRPRIKGNIFDDGFAFMYHNTQLISTLKFIRPGDKIYINHIMGGGMEFELSNPKVFEDIADYIDDIVEGL